MDNKTDNPTTPSSTPSVPSTGTPGSSDASHTSTPNTPLTSPADAAAKAEALDADKKSDMPHTDAPAKPKSSLLPLGMILGFILCGLLGFFAGRASVPQAAAPVTTTENTQVQPTQAIEAAEPTAVQTSPTESQNQTTPTLPLASPTVGSVQPTVVQ